ncbi:hypothetical protein Aperf_G00000078896 [Anoplocephala perfoliata]
MSSVSWLLPSRGSQLLANVLYEEVNRGIDDDGNMPVLKELRCVVFESAGFNPKTALDIYLCLFTTCCFLADGFESATARSRAARLAKENSCRYLECRFESHQHGGPSTLLAVLSSSIGVSECPKLAPVPTEILAAPSTAGLTPPMPPMASTIVTTWDSP